MAITWSGDSTAATGFISVTPPSSSPLLISFSSCGVFADLDLVFLAGALGHVNFLRLWLLLFSWENGLNITRKIIIIIIIIIIRVCIALYHLTISKWYLFILFYNIFIILFNDYVVIEIFDSIITYHMLIHDDICRLGYTYTTHIVMHVSCWTIWSFVWKSDIKYMWGRSRTFTEY